MTSSSERVAIELRDLVSGNVDFVPLLPQRFMEVAAQP